ncbi:MAG: xanthine dehydrogenase accessory protein XdhC [Rubrivivax sp.]
MSASDTAVRTTAADWIAAGRRATVVTVRNHRGSVPRETGARMIVAHDNASDAVAGSVGGGHLEWQAIAHARSGRREPWAVALGPSLGQCCGGAVTLAFAPLDAAALADWPTPEPCFFLQLYGAGHVGRAIVRALADIECRVRWVDERADAFPPGAVQRSGAHPGSVEAVVADPIEAEVDAAPEGACHLILTHSHDLDLRLTGAVLHRRAGDARWIGLIGSATKRARFEHRLTERGLSTEVLARLVCPIGLAGVGSKAPAEIAVAVVAQLLALPAAGSRPAQVAGPSGGIRA